jgi:hypothetical protein
MRAGLLRTSSCSIKQESMTLVNSRSPSALLRGSNPKEASDANCGECPGAG